MSFLPFQSIFKSCFSRVGLKFFITSILQKWQIKFSKKNWQKNSSNGRGRKSQIPNLLWTNLVTFQKVCVMYLVLKVWSIPHPLKAILHYKRALASFVLSTTVSNWIFWHSSIGRNFLDWKEDLIKFKIYFQIIHS